MVIHTNMFFERPDDSCNDSHGPPRVNADSVKISWERDLKMQKIHFPAFE